MVALEDESLRVTVHGKSVEIESPLFKGRGIRVLVADPTDSETPKYAMASILIDFEKRGEKIIPQDYDRAYVTENGEIIKSGDELDRYNKLNPRS